MRLAQYLALCGICSRKEASRRITQGRVTYQDRLANHVDTIPEQYLAELRASASHLLTAQNQPESNYLKLDLSCDGMPVGTPEQKQYWLYNKPVGIDCRLLPEQADSLFHVIKHLPRLFPVGRLDKDSHGLLLLTNDGELSHKLMHPSFAHTKTYRVQVDRNINTDFIGSMSIGVSYKKVTTLPCQITQITADQFEIVLTQGLNRQIRRMSQALGYKVIDLQRIAIGALNLNDLACSALRQLNNDELGQLPALTH